MNPVVFEYLTAANKKRIALATLNAPQSLNALNITMIEQLLAQLTLWKNDNSVVAIVLQGSGERAFCAGGDVVSLYRECTDGTLTIPASDTAIVNSLAHRFFSQEYQLDQLIHEYTKPIIAWGTGYVMGGGIGLFAGASHRIVTQRTLMAMPEITIGLYPDVGGSYFLNQMPENIGLFLGLTGQTFNGKDACYIGLGDFLIDHDDKKTLFDGLLTIPWKGDSQDNALLTQYLSSAEKDPSRQNEFTKITKNIEPAIDIINKACQHATITELFAALQSLNSDNDWLNKAINKLSHGSPLSACVIFNQLKITKHLSLQACLKSELNLSLRFCQHREFYEGVRALLVTKDKSPDWTYKNIDDVEQRVLNHFFTPLPNLSES